MALRADLTKDYQTEPRVPVTRWEYAVVQVSDMAVSALTDTLTTMGAYGWELVTQREGGFGLVRRGNDHFAVLLFKRPTG